MKVDIDSFWTWAFGLVATGVAWLIRRVLTNEKQIAILEASEKQRDQDMTEMKHDIKKLLQKHE